MKKVSIYIFTFTHTKNIIIELNKQIKLVIGKRRGIQNTQHSNLNLKYPQSLFTEILLPGLLSLGGGSLINVT